MRTVTKLLVAAAMLGGSALATTVPANADFSLGIGIGVPGPVWTGDYDYYRPCWWYRQYDLPAPYRCYRYYYGLWGPAVYIDGDFIFADRDDWWRWHDRDDYRHWHDHDFAFHHDWNHDRGWDHREAGWDRGGWDHHDHGGWDRGNNGWGRGENRTFDRGGNGGWDRGGHGGWGGHEHGDGDHHHGR